MNKVPAGKAGQKKIPPFAAASVLNGKHSGLKAKTSKQPEVNRMVQTEKVSAPLVKTSAAKKFRLAPEQLVKIHDYMVKTRALEERMIKMFKQSDGYFWLGGPGEEAFAVPLGMQGKIGQGVHYDFWHLHYRSSGILMPMGLDPMGCIRQMKNVAADPHSGGRNFANHLSVREWNVVPITSTIETQYLTAIGSAIAQKQEAKDSITVVTGGDAGTAEGDFASALVWSTRPGNELPMLIIVTNNAWGISTAACTQHGDKIISDRGKAFGMKTRTINGLDVEESWFAIKEAMDYIRTERKPYFLESIVSRMYGHSSATGANLVPGEADPIATFETQLAAADIMTPKEMSDLREEYNAQMLEMAKRVKEEAMPDPSTIYDYTYYGQKGRYW
jgi:2-oxoisovalerate dehydrogenase E1 component alpha subunit